MMLKAKNVTDYISMAPKDVQGKLQELRSTIKNAAPKALEKISYGMPYYHYNGRLAYFAHTKQHIGLYIPPPVVAQYAKELKSYSAERATIRFPLDKQLPLALIRKLIKARARINDATITKKKIK